MTNILVVDTLLECGVLVKGVLMGRPYGVSLSSDYDEAMQKLNTGLFDIICINTDLELGHTASLEFLDEAKRLLPDLPAIALTERQPSRLVLPGSPTSRKHSGKMPGVEDQSAPRNDHTQIFRTLTKPLSIAQLTTAVREAIEYLKSIQPQKSPHKALRLATELISGNASLKCLMTDLGLQGALVSSDISSDPETKQFSAFFLKRLEKIITSIPTQSVGTSSPIKLLAQLAFTETRPDGGLRQAGLRFPSLTLEEQKLVGGLITQAA